MQFFVFISSIGVTYETCIWGGRTSRRSTCRWFSLQSPHMHFFTCRLSINIPCTCAFRTRYSSHFSSASHNRSQAKRSCCCCSGKAVHEISLLTQVLLWHLLSRALGGHLVAFVDLLSCCFPLVKVVFAVPFLLCARIASAAVHRRACALSPQSPYRNEEFCRDRCTCT